MGEIRRLIEEVLRNAFVMTFGNLDVGVVWVSDVIYVYDTNFNIYWRSQITTRHSKAIEKNKTVSVTITTSSQGGKNEGLQIEGVAEKIDGSNMDLFAAHLHKRLGEVPHTMYLDENKKLVDAEISWYKLKPTKIELIYEKHFGFDKQAIILN